MSHIQLGLTVSTKSHRSKFFGKRRAPVVRLPEPPAEDEDDLLPDPRMNSQEWAEWVRRTIKVGTAEDESARESR
jgi:hypothetical protein